MPSIDERVVSMAFENAVFEQRVATTMQSLSKLNTAIANTGQNSGLSKQYVTGSTITSLPRIAHAKPPAREWMTARAASASSPTAPTPPTTVRTARWRRAGH